MMKKKPTHPLPRQEMFGDSYNCELVLEKVVGQEWCDNIPPPECSLLHPYLVMLVLN